MPAPLNDTERRQAVQTAVKTFAEASLQQASIKLLNTLGYSSEKIADFGSKPEQFVAAAEEATHSTFNRDKAHVSRWKQCAFLFQLTNDEIPSLSLPSPFGRGAGGEGLARSLIESFVFLAIELQGESWSRTRPTTAPPFLPSSSVPPSRSRKRRWRWSEKWPEPQQKRATRKDYRKAM